MDTLNDVVISEQIWNDELLKRYKNDLDAFCQMARGAGVIIKRGGAASWERFDAHPDFIKRAIVDNFHAYTEVCEETIREGESIIDDQQFLWRMFSKLNLRPTNDFFSQLEAGDVVEVYDRNLHQVFRNLEFFEVCSYTLEDLMHYPMYELFEREQAHTSVIVSEVQSFIKQEKTSTIRMQIPIHTAREIFSEQKFIAQINQKLMSPLFSKQRQIEAVVATISIKILNDNTSFMQH